MRLLLCMALLTLSACTTTSERIAVADIAITKEVCSAWPVVTYSGLDTERTRREARANNAARAVYCGGTNW